MSTGFERKRRLGIKLAVAVMAASSALIGVAVGPAHADAVSIAPLDADFNILPAGETTTNSVNVDQPTGYIAGPSSIGVVSTDSAKGCTGYFSPAVTCIYVQGASTHVDHISGTRDNTEFGEYSRYRIFQNGSLIAASAYKYVKSGSYLVGTWSPNRNFPDRAQICVDFEGYSGHPCETIYK